MIKLKELGYTVKKVLGQGAYGIVYSVVCKKGSKSAVKVTELRNDNEINNFDREIDFLKLVKDDPLFVQMRYFVPFDKQDKKRFLIFMDKESMNLFDALDKGPDLNVKIHYFIGLINCLYVLHDKYKYYHQDIKIENILIDRNGNIKLADFGFIQNINTQSKFIKGTPGINAPEKENFPYFLGACNDIYSAGLVGFYIFTKSYPNKMIREAIKDGNAIIFPKEIPEKIAKLIYDMLEYDYEKRITIQDVKKRIEEL